jgi:hypothetical protein
VIGPGWLPRPSARLRLARTPAYMRGRRRARAASKKAALPGAPVNHQGVLFDLGARELPIATVRPREPRARALVLLGDLRRWLAARWTWLRPRTVPVLVAAAGMLFVLVSADYLKHAHGTPPHRVTNVPIQFR